MHILITGATGLIGKELIRLLLEDNNKVHYLTTSKNKIDQLQNCYGYYWNPLQGEIDENCIDGIEVIIHLAGASIAKRWTKKYKKELFDSRILSANLLFELLQKSKHTVKHFITASGTAIYPDSDTIIYDEQNEQKDSTFLGNLVSKWEDSADQFEKLNLKVTKLRTGIVLSNKGGALVEMIKPIKMFVGSFFGSGKQMQSWIHLKDLVTLYNFVTRNQIDGVVNAVTPYYISNKELTLLLAKRLHRPLLLPNIPKVMMKLILGEMHVLLFQNKKIIPIKALSIGFEFEFETAVKAIDCELK